MAKAPLVKTVQPGTSLVLSPLRHLDTASVGEEARIETRNREVHIPPVSVYRWWARRTEAVNGAIIEAYSQDWPGRLLVADPFAGGGVIPLSAILRNHRVYAQDLNPWATEGLSGMLGLPSRAAIDEAARRLHDLMRPSLTEAYGTHFPDGSDAEISHCFRVAVAPCSHCGERGRLFPHALISLRMRRERKVPDAFLACPAGHVFLGTEGKVIRCPECRRMTDPSENYTTNRTVTCWACGEKDKLEIRAQAEGWDWEVVLIERSQGRDRYLTAPNADQLFQAREAGWRPTKKLPAIAEGQETRVLTRHGFKYWHDLYPARQRVMIERLLAFAAEAAEDDQTLHAIRLAIISSAEMAGLMSRWDRFYLKSYETMAGHRFNFSTFVAEPNVWGASASGRGTVRRRLESLGKTADWMHTKVGRTLRVQGPIASTGRRSSLGERVDVRVVEGSSERIALPDEVVDLVLTDPPYHDDVQYSELSMPLRSWAALSVEHLLAEASVNQVSEHNSAEDEYEELLARIFAEARRTLQPTGHLIFSYANRQPEAWIALLGALHKADLRACGYAIVHSENETDVSKRNVRACTLDLILDLVPRSDAAIVEQWKPRSVPDGAEGEFLRMVGDRMLRVGCFEDGWRAELTRCLKGSEFLQDPEEDTVLASH